MAFNLQTALDKMTSKDPDFRFMASNDLLTELGRPEGLRLADSERKVAQALLYVLEDTQSENRALAVRCMGLLVKQLGEDSIGMMLRHMASSLQSPKPKKEFLRDVCAMGMKTLIVEAPEGRGEGMVSILMPLLIAGIQEGSPPATGRAGPPPSLEARFHFLDVLSTLLERRGALLHAYYGDLMAALLPSLDSEPSLRKKATLCLGRLSVFVSPKLFREMMAHLLAKTEEKTMARRYLVAVGQVARCSGHRVSFQEYIQHLFPVLRQYIGASKLGGEAADRKSAEERSDLLAGEEGEDEGEDMEAVDAEDEDEDEDEELRESVLHIFELLLLRCPRAQTAAYVPEIQLLALHFLAHDPNFIADDPMEVEGGEGADEEIEDGSEDDEVLSDDADISWKVRRAAAKTLTAAISTRPDLLQAHWEAIVPQLVARFREREENVKMDVFQAFTELLRQTAAHTAHTSHTAYTAHTSHTAYTAHTPPLHSPGRLRGRGEEDPVLESLRARLPSVVGALVRELRREGNSAKTRVGALGVLRQLVLAAPRDPFDEKLLAQLVPELAACLREKSSAASNLRLEALLFLRAALPAHAPLAFVPHLPALAPLVYAAARESSYKLTAEALRVCGGVVDVLAAESGRDAATWERLGVDPLYQAVLRRLQAQTDVDLEVKEAAIQATGHLVAQLGDRLGARGRLGVVLPLLLDRLRNEICRFAAVRAVQEIVSSPHAEDKEFSAALQDFLPNAVAELGTFLRKSNRLLRHSALECLSLVARRFASAGAGVWVQVLRDAALLVSDADLHLSNLSLRLAVGLLEAEKSDRGGAADMRTVVQSEVLPPAFRLLGSAVVQGGCLESLLALFGALGAGGRTDQQLVVEQLHSVATKPGSSLPPLPATRAALQPLAMCIAAAALGEPHGVQQGILPGLVKRYVSTLGRKGVSEAERLLALLALGEVGSRTDVTGGGEESAAWCAVLAAFDAEAEEAKSVAAWALGSLAVGNLSVSLPRVIEEVKNTPSRRYLLLHSLREILTRLASSSAAGDAEEILAPHRYALLELLFDACRAAEEGTRTVVAECLGRLTAVIPIDLVSLLASKLTACPPEPAAVRGTVLDAVKAAVTERGGAAAGGGGVEGVELEQQQQQLLQALGEPPRTPRENADLQLAQHFGVFMGALLDSDLGVRRCAFLALNHAAHNRPALVRPLLRGGAAVLTPSGCEGGEEGARGHLKRSGTCPTTGPSACGLSCEPCRLVGGRGTNETAGRRCGCYHRLLREGDAL